MMQDKNRLYLNVVRGIAVFLMLWGHCIQYCAQGTFDAFENTVFKFIYSFHMPLFMLISGYLFYFSFRKRTMKELLIHRTQGMLQPIVMAGIFNAALRQLANLFLRAPVHLLDGALLWELHSFWFLWCVLSGSLAVTLACKMTENNWLQLLYLAAGTVLVMLFKDMHLHLFMYPYFVAGFLYGKYQEHIGKTAKRIAWLALPVFSVMLYFCGRRHFIYNTPVFGTELAVMDYVRINGFRWGIGFAGSVSALLLIRVFLDFAEHRKWFRNLIRGAGILGENSLAIYCLSVVLLSGFLPPIYDKAVQILGSDVFLGNMDIYNYVFTPALAVAYSFLLYGVVRLLKKWHLHKLLFGR